MTSHDRSCISSTSSVFLQNCDWNCYPASVTGTKGPVITSHGPVQFQLFSSHSNWTFKHYTLCIHDMLDMLFSFYLPYSLLTLCSIRMDNLVPLYDTTPLPLCPCPCPTYNAILIFSIVTSLFTNMYASLYSQVYIPCTL